MAIEWEVYQQIRRMYYAESISQRAIARKLGLNRKTVMKYCKGQALPDVRKLSERPSPLLAATEETILRLLEENKTLPRKQQWDAHRIWQHLLSVERIAVGASTVREHVRLLRKRYAEEFIPLVHDPGEAMQVDWGDVTAFIDGKKTAISVFVATLPHSGAVLAFLYPDKTMLSFLDGHIQAFEMFGGVPRFCVYDNL